MSIVLSPRHNLIVHIEDSWITGLEPITYCFEGNCFDREIIKFCYQEFFKLWIRQIGEEYRISFCNIIFPKMMNENVNLHCHPKFSQTKTHGTWNCRPLFHLSIHCSANRVRLQLRKIFRITFLLIILRENRWLQNLHLCNMT